MATAATFEGHHTALLRATFSAEKILRYNTAYISSHFNAMDAVAPYLILTTVCAIVGLITAAAFSIRIAAMPEGTPKMAEVAQMIRVGAMAFLRKEYQMIAIFMALASLFIYYTIDKNGMPATTLSFLCGALASLASGYIGMHTATIANVRTTEAARENVGKGMRIAFLSGATLGLSVVGLGLLGLTLVLFTLLFVVRVADWGAALTITTGFSFGASSIALFARVGGGIFTKAADVGADLVGKIEAGIPEDDPRNPAVIADNVGDNVGDIAGMGADLFESYVGSILAAMIIGWTSIQTDSAVLFPLSVSAFGILASVIASFFVRTKKKGRIDAALRRGILLSSLIIIGAAYVLARHFFPVTTNAYVTANGVYTALISGLIAGVLIGLLAEYYTSARFSPVRHIAESSGTGAGTNVIAGLALGFLSTGFTILVLVLCIGIAHLSAGLYGIAIAAVGMLSTLGVSLAVDAYGPVADNAGGIAEMCGLPHIVREHTDQLDAAGNTTAAIGKGFAIGSAALTALALFAAYADATKLMRIDLMNPMVFIGLLLGGALPFLFSAMTMNAVGKAAHAMIVEVRRQFKVIPGLLEGKAKGDSARCVAISTSAALREMIAPGCLAILSPLVVGYTLGSHALGGLLAGSLVTGLLLAISMANAGGAWDNAKKYIESGKLGGKGSSAHMAAIVGDTVGDPFKDTSGPSINILIKLVSIVALLTAGLYTANGIIG
ncbi:MAG TPA: sodium-translocating pyrophosphatase [Candidatus Peribacterales bacterium]|nr:sodium-translocating pyrophosphatase [Candidatus Peribacterales bacterium]